MVSDSTLISMPLKGLAALTNHSISFIWSSLDSVEGWNSLSTHFLASSMPAMTGLANDAAANRATDASRFFRIDFLRFIIGRIECMVDTWLLLRDIGLGGWGDGTAQGAWGTEPL